MELHKKLFIISQIFVYFLGLIIIIQLLRLIFGGSWKPEDVILAILTINITVTLTIGGYLFYANNSLLNKMHQLDKRLYGHMEWHKGK